MKTLIKDYWFLFTAYFKRWNGDRTLPETVYKCEMGDHWIEAPYKDVRYLQTPGRFDDSPPTIYPFVYKYIYQNSWGVWTTDTRWLQVWNEMDLLRK